MTYFRTINNGLQNQKEKKNFLLYCQELQEFVSLDFLQNGKEELKKTAWCWHDTDSEKEACFQKYDEVF